MLIFEAVMLICFGAAWPISIYKMLKTKHAAGKSKVFLVILMFGYFCGILFKLTGHADPVIILYILNVVLVCIDLILTIRYSSPKYQVRCSCSS